MIINLIVNRFYKVFRKVLGSLLFILFINDLPNALIFSDATLFAGIYSHSSLKAVEKLINIGLKPLFMGLN